MEYKSLRIFDKLKFFAKNNPFLTKSTLLSLIVFFGLFVFVNTAYLADTITLNPVSGSCAGTNVYASFNWTSTIIGTPTYHILRKLQGEAIFTEINSTQNLFYVDNSGNIISDKTATYQIKATAGTDIYSIAQTLPAQHCGAVLTPPSPSCQADGPHISVNWSGASGTLLPYEIYRQGANIGTAAAAPFDDNQSHNLQGTQSYDYYVRTRWQDGYSTSSQTANVDALACPPVITSSNGYTACAASSPGGPQANITWNNLLGVQNYQVERKALSEINFSLLNTITQPNYIDNLVNSLSQSYFQNGNVLYNIKAVWPTGQITPSTSIQTNTIAQCPPFLTVQGSCQDFAPYNSPQMNLTWTATQDADHYNIYKNGSPTGDQISAPATSWVDLSPCAGSASSCTTKYQVKAVVSQPPTIDSAEVTQSVDCSTVPPPPQPVINEAYPLCFGDGTSRVHLSWTPTSYTSYYRVYYTSGPLNGNQVQGIPTIDYQVQSGLDYVFWVEAVGAGGGTNTTLSQQTAPIHAVSCNPPNATTIYYSASSCNQGSPYIDISWLPATINTEAYEIWRGPALGSMSLVATFDKNSAEYTSRTWRDTNPQNNYYYQIVSVGPLGVAATISTNAPNPPIYSCLPNSVALSLGKNCQSNNPVVNLSWTHSSANTHHYEIFREDFSTTVPIRYEYDTSIQNWTSTGLNSQTPYRYKVDAVGFGASPPRTSSGYQSITTDNCSPAGAFTLNNPSISCNGPWPLSSLSWSASSNANSYDMIRTKVSNGSTETALSVNSPYTDKGFHNALSFNGINNYLATAWSPTLGISGSITLETWVKIADPNLNSDMAIFTKKAANLSTDYGFYLNYNPSTNSLKLYTNATNIGEAIVDLDTSWHHIVATVSGTTAKFYVDGVDRTTDGSIGPLQSTGSDFEIAANRFMSMTLYYFYGSLDEMRIYSRALTPAEVIEHYNAVYNDETGLRALWHFDETSGSTATDSSNSNYLGHAEDATITATRTTDGPQAGTTYAWQAKANGPGGSTLSNSTNQNTIPTCQPTKPGLVLNPLCSGGLSSITLRWSYTTATTKYEIYRQDYLGGTTPLATTTSLTYTDNNKGTGLTPSTNYTYWVKAIGPAGQSQSDNIVSGLTQSCAAPPTPGGLTASFICSGTGNSFPQINVLWSASSGATSYSLYRTPSFSGTPFITTAATSYSDTNVTTTYSYFYNVSATGPGGTSPLSPSTSNVYINYCTPSTPSITSINATCNGTNPENTISWSDATPFNTFTYEIYRNTTNSIPGSPIKIISTSTTPAEFTSRSWTDNFGLASNTNYYYWVKTIGPAGSRTTLTPFQRQTNNCAAAPIAPTLNGNPFCENNLPYATFTWNNVANALSYNLSRINPDMTTSIYSTRLSPLTDRGAFSLQFDGADDSVSIPDNASLSPTSAMSFSAWVYQDSLIANKPIASKWDYPSQETWLIRVRTTGSQGLLWVNIAPNLTDLYTTKGQTALGSWTAGQWHHIAFTYNGAGTTNAEKLKIYIDGVQKPLTFSGTIPASLTDSTANLKIGQETGSIDNFNGKIDDARMYNRTLSGPEITQQFNNNYRNESGLVGTWHFDEGSGTTAYDQSGRGNNGTLLNGPTWQTTVPNNLRAQALARSSPYSYTLKAFGADTESLPSAPPVSFVSPSCEPAKPILVIDSTDCTNQISKLLLSWGADANTNNWVIHKKRVGDIIESPPFPFSTTNTFYDDLDVLSGVHYDYYLDAIGSGFATTSGIVSATAPTCTEGPTKPVISSVSPACYGTNSKVLVSWGQDPNGKTLSYNIWRKMQGEPSFSKIYTGLSATTLQFLDSTVLPGNSYEYKVEGIGSGGVTAISDPSAPPSIARDCANAPPDAPNLYYDGIHGDTADLLYLTIRWTDAGPEYAHDDFINYGSAKAGYRVYRKLHSQSDNDWHVIKELPGNDDITDIFWTDTAVTDNETYDYMVVAFNDSKPYDPAIGTEGYRSGAYSNIYTIHYPTARPGNFTLNPGQWINKKLQLTWTAAATTPAGGPVTYDILRDDTPDFLSPRTICHDISITDCLDNNPSFSEPYYKAVAKNNGGTTDSNTIQIGFANLQWKETIPW